MLTLADITVERRVSRNPLAVYLLGFAALAGAIQLLINRDPKSVQETLSPWMQTAWSLSLIVGPIVTLIGIYWRKPYLGMQLETLGLLGTATAALTYSVALASYSGTAGVFSICLTAAFGGAGLHRWRTVSGLVKRMRTTELL